MPEATSTNPSPTPTQTSPSPTSTPQPTSQQATTSTEQHSDAPETTLLTAQEPSVTAPEGAPESYSDFKSAEGRTLDKASLDEARPIFKELNLTQDQAQKLVDLYSKFSDKATADFQSRMKETRETWTRDSQAWLDANGGANANKQNIGKAINIVFDNDAAKIQQFRAFMDSTWAGSNPSFVQAFATMAKAFVEGRAVQGDSPSEHGQQEPGRPARPSLAEGLYGPNGPRRDRWTGNPNQSQPQSG